MKEESVPATPGPLAQKRYVVAMCFNKLGGENLEQALRLVVLTAQSKDEAMGAALSKVWEDLRGFQLNTWCATEVDPLAEGPALPESNPIPNPREGAQP